MPEDYNPDDYLTAPEVARLWKISRQAVVEAIKRGSIPALQTPTGRYLIHKRDAALRPTGEATVRPT
jgi:excisionase family DNA binding protein